MAPVITRIVGVAGKVLVGLGVLILLFAAYQLWGTGVLESHSQAQLRAKFDSELPPGAALKARRLSVGVKAPPPPQNGPPQVAPTVAAPATGQPVGIIDIPSIGVNQVVVEGVTTADLRTGPGHYPGTPLPGESGNASIAGHRTTYAHPFYDLNAVAPGDRIVVTTAQGIFVYSADTLSTVSPTDVAVVAPTSGAELTLTTCTPRYSASTRLVLHATLVQSTFYTAPPPAQATTTTTTTTTRPPAVAHRVRRAAGDLAGKGGGVDWFPVVAWGLAAAVVAVAARLAAARTRLGRLAYLPGAVVLLVVLFFFFTAVSPLLPASF
jgi:sortase A